MKNKKKVQRTFVAGLSSVLVAQAMLPVVSATTTTSEVPQQVIDLEIIQNQKVDIALTVGETGVDPTTFKEDLSKALEARNVLAENVNIDTFETATVSSEGMDASTIFNTWGNLPAGSGSRWSLTRNNEIYSNVDSKYTIGWINPDGYGQDQQFSFKTRSADGWHFNPWGWMFKVKQREDGKYDLYKLYTIRDYEYGWTDRTSKLIVGIAKIKGHTFNVNDGFNHVVSIPVYMTDSPEGVRIDNKYGYPSGYNEINNTSVIETNKVYTSSKINGMTVEHLGVTAIDVGQVISSSLPYQQFDISMEGGHIEVKMNGETVIDVIDEDPLKEGTYGPWSTSSPNVYFKDFALHSSSHKDFLGTISKPKWSEHTERFVVNLDDQETADLDDPHKSGQILSRLMNEDVHYVGLGTDVNKVQTERFVAKNSGQGTFIDNTDYAASIEQLADYIADELQKNVKTVSNDHPYVLRDTPIRFNHDEVSGSKWTLTHDDTHFENSEGTSLLDSLALSQLPTSFDKTGAYQVKYGNQNVEPQIIYAHRLPTAAFDIAYTKTDEGITVTTTDLSYDVDHLSTDNKGIVERKWRWKETSATEWNEGTLPANLPEGKHYLLQLQVKDVEGEWSLPVTNYVTTDPTVQSFPMANFTLPQKHDVSEELTILDHSYDPAGHALTTTNWVVYRNGAKIYTGDAPITNFAQYGVGTYAYELTVTNALGNQSETFTRQVEVHEPNYTKVKEQMELVTKGILDGTTSVEEAKDILGQTEGLVNDLVDTGNKTDAQNDLAELNKALIAIEAVEKAEGVKPLSSKSKIATVKDLIATAKPLVAALPKGEIKSALEERLQALETKLVDAENNLIQVEIHENAEPSFVGLSWQPFDEFKGIGTLDYKIVVKQYDEETDTFVNSTFDRSSKTTDIDIQGLTPGTYEFSVYPRKNGVVISDEPIGMVVVDIPEPTKAAAPTVQNVVATGVDATTATITWDAFEGAKRYRVQYYVQDALTGEFVKEGYGRTTTIPSLTINTLNAGQTYKFDVTPYVTKFDDANKGDSNVITLTVPVVEEPPVVENRLHVEAVNETTANLSWEKLEGEQDRYRVQLYVKNDAGIFEKVGFARAIPETTFVYSNLTPGLEYKFEVVPRFNYIYDTSKAFTETIVMPSKEEPPVTTENKQLENFAVNMQGKTAELSWDALKIAGENVTAYRVHRYVKDELTGQYKWELTRTALGTNYLDTYKLHSGKTYRYEIIPRVGFVYDESYKTTSADIVNP